MKKVYLLLCFVIYNHIAFCQPDSLERIRTVHEIDLIVEKINNNTRNINAMAFYDSTRGWKGAKIFVWLWEGRIVKIKDIVSYQHGKKSVTEYYYSYKPALIKRGNRVRTGEEDVEENFTLPDSLFEKYYYEYDDLISGNNFFILDDDTFYFGPAYLKDAYATYRKYYHLQIFNPFKDLKYDKIVAYDFEGRGDLEIIEGNKLNKSARNPKELTKEQADIFISAITDTATYGGNNAACFDPHMGVVFYNGNAIVAHVSICFECNSLASSAYLPAEYYNLHAWEGKNYYQTRILHGFSPAGHKKLKQLCGTLGLSLCPTGESIWENPDMDPEEER